MKSCALCREKKELMLSHIVPKMAIRNLKKTAVGKIRRIDNPNKTVQDSEKLYMLCRDCEELFSKKESYFANNIFHPYIKKDRVSFGYDKNLFYFLTSLSWRSLYLDLIDFVQNNLLGIDALECLISSELSMRRFLLNEKENIEGIEHHIFFFDEIAEVHGNNKLTIEELRPHTTIHRGIVSYTFCYENEKTYGTITNMLGIMVFTFYSLGIDEVWERTRIFNGESSIEAKDQKVRSVAGNEIIDILENTANSFKSISDVQQKKIDGRVKKAGERFKDYPIYEDLINDLYLSKNL